MHQKGGDLNRDRQVARPGGWLDWVAKTLVVYKVKLLSYYYRGRYKGTKGVPTT